MSQRRYQTIFGTLRQRLLCNCSTIKNILSLNTTTSKGLLVTYDCLNLSVGLVYRLTLEVAKVRWIRREGTASIDVRDDEAIDITAGDISRLLLLIISGRARLPRQR